MSIEYDRTYTGMTNNIERRLKEHNNLRSKSTKAFAPWILIYQEEFETRAEARKKEKYLKSGNGREFLKTLINKRPRGATE